MKKTDKKIEKKLVSALTVICDLALDRIEGFQWLTHTVNFNQFPHSLTVICVFDTHDNLAQARVNGAAEQLQNWICDELKRVDIVSHTLKNRYCLILRKPVMRSMRGAGIFDCVAIKLHLHHEP